MKKLSFLISALFIVNSAFSQVFAPVETEYVDLGLPSGLCWKKNNEQGYYSYEKSIKKFSNIPSKENWQELRDYCTWHVENNCFIAVGPNGNTISFSVDGLDYSGGYQSSVEYKNDRGYYRTTTKEGGNSKLVHFRVSSYNDCIELNMDVNIFVFGDDYFFTDLYSDGCGAKVRLVKMLE